MGFWFPFPVRRLQLWTCYHKINIGIRLINRLSIMFQPHVSFGYINHLLKANIIYEFFRTVWPVGPSWMHVNSFGCVGRDGG